MMDHHISSDWKVTHFKGTAVKKNLALITLFLIVKSSPSHSFINHITESVCFSDILIALKHYYLQHILCNLYIDTVS
jgi:hypothetical protein